MNDTVDVVEQNELTMEQVVSNTTNNKKLCGSEIINNRDVVGNESVTASSGFNVKKDGNVELLSHVSSLNCFDSNDVGGDECYEVEQQHEHEHVEDVWDLDTSEKAYNTILELESTRISSGSGKHGEDGISKENVYLEGDDVIHDVGNRFASQSATRTRSKNAGNPSISVRQGCTGGVSISNAMQFKEDCEDVDRIDSALLSALNDPKERMGLLRLEKVLIDFMNDRSIMYMDVGGPNNSIVLKEGANAAETNRGRQTSFQRLCLHRLADRFNIVRESLPSPVNDDYYTTATATTPSLIRLVKMNDSKIPTRLLIDVDLSDDKNSDLENDHSMRSLTNSLSATSLNASTAASNVKQEKPRRKMKIMKRRSGDSQTSSSQTKTNQNKNKGKKLSEKEKAYAEARARIFNELEERRRAEADASPITESPIVPNRELNPSPSPSSARSDKSSNVDNEVYEVDDPDQKNISSKVTWRNRRQEENDPDFRRGNVVRAQQTSMSQGGVPYVHGVFNYMHPSQVLPTDSAHATNPNRSTAHYPPQHQVYYPPQVNSSNPYVQQQPYYPPQHNTTAQSQQYYAQHGSRSMQQPYHQMLYPNANTTAQSSKEKIVYSMDEFPPIG